MGARSLAVLGAVAAVLAAGACSSTPQTLDEALSRGPTPTAIPTTTPSTAPVARPFPHSCAELVPPGALVAALGAGRLGGRTTFLYAGPVPHSGRLERTTCGFGVRKSAWKGGSDKVRVEVSMVRYATAAAATDRVAATAEAAGGSGKRVRPWHVGDRAGYTISDRSSTSGVLPDGARTLVVTIRSGVVPVAATRVALGELSRRVLDPPAAGSG